MTSPRLKAALDVFVIECRNPAAVISASGKLLAVIEAERGSYTITGRYRVEAETKECYCEGNTFCPQHMPRDATGFPLGSAAPEPDGRLNEIEHRLDGLDEDVAMLINQRKPTPESELTRMEQEDGEWDAIGPEMTVGEALEESRRRAEPDSYMPTGQYRVVDDRLYQIVDRKWAPTSSTRHRKKNMATHQCDCEFCELCGESRAEEKSNMQYLVIKAAQAWRDTVRTGFESTLPGAEWRLDQAVEALEREGET